MWRASKLKINNVYTDEYGFKPKGRIEVPTPEQHVEHIEIKVFLKLSLKTVKCTGSTIFLYPYFFVKVPFRPFISMCSTCCSGVGTSILPFGLNPYSSV